MTRPLSFRVIEGGRDKPTYPRDDMDPSRGVLIACALSVPLWVPTWWGLAWLAAVARMTMGGR